jgi:hypothetical protein
MAFLYVISFLLDSWLKYILPLSTDYDLALLQARLPHADFFLGVD